MMKLLFNRYLDNLFETYPEIITDYGFNDFIPANYLMNHLGSTYEAVINIPNLQTADFLYNPLISPGIEVEDDDEKGINDFIFSWAMDESGNFIETIIGENQALEMKNPLFVVTPHAANDVEIILDESISTGEEKRITKINSSKNSTERLDITRYQVNNPFFFEGSGDLEYRVEMLLTNSNNALFNSSLSFNRQIDIDRDDVEDSELFIVNLEIGNFPMGTLSNLSRDFYTLSYERDWYAEREDILCSCSCSQSSLYNFRARMKYSNEFYYRKCGKTNDQWPAVNDFFEEINNKGRIKIKRTM